VNTHSLVLAGDVGGTKTDIAVFSSDAGLRAPLARETFRNREYPGLAAIACEFLDRTKLPIVAACFDVAGPVVSGQAVVTNLPWVVSEGALRDALSIDAIRLLNDLEATAIAVPTLQPVELHTLSPCRPVPGGVVGVIAPGTGLGEAFLTWDGANYHAHASEGGHTDFGPTSDDQIALLAQLRQHYDHVSYELVCSGIGIPVLYQYMRDTSGLAELRDAATRLPTAEDQTPIIVEAALAAEMPSPLCAATLELFASILGAEAGNLALKVLATGGVFVGGGIPPRILPVLDHGGFLQAFQHKGRLSRVLADTPVHVILSPAALMGAAQCAFQLADQR
jgi:glucokinase